MRAAQAALVVGCAICDSRGFLGSRAALIVALALSLGLTTPMIALAAIGRVGPLSASVAALAALAVGVARAVAMATPPGDAEMLETALVAAVAAFVSGALASVFAPRRAPLPTPSFDLFADASEQEQTPRLVVDSPIAARQNPPALARVLAVPGRDDAARPFDNRRKGDDVVRL